VCLSANHSTPNGAAEFPRLTARAAKRSARAPYAGGNDVVGGVAAVNSMIQGRDTA